MVKSILAQPIWTVVGHAIAKYRRIPLSNQPLPLQCIAVYLWSLKCGCISNKLHWLDLLVFRSCTYACAGKLLSSESSTLWLSFRKSSNMKCFWNFVKYSVRHGLCMRIHITEMVRLHALKVYVKKLFKSCCLLVIHSTPDKYVMYPSLESFTVGEYFTI